MELNLEYVDGQTPLDEEEKEGLMVNSITTRGELDEFEQLNIEKAVAWTLGRTFDKGQIITEGYIRELHKRMFGEVWKWAGDFRHSDKNIGVKWPVIGIELKKLLDDMVFWLDNGTYAGDEAAVRFKHRIVNIHCFPNGNGRHSRLIADVIVKNIFGQKEFSWGGGNLIRPGDIRRNYLNSIRQADSGNIQPLIAFARS
jgi:Fic-DOC domain mobile mystery protein B